MSQFFASGVQSIGDKQVLNKYSYQFTPQTIMEALGRYQDQVVNKTHPLTRTIQGVKHSDREA